MAIPKITPPPGSSIDSMLATLQQGSNLFANQNTTDRTSISSNGMNALLDHILSNNQGLAQVAQGEKTSGLYNSTVSQQLINDLLTRSAGEVASRDSTRTTSVKAPLSGQLASLAGTLGLAKSGYNAINDMSGGAIGKKIKSGYDALMGNDGYTATNTGTGVQSMSPVADYATSNVPQVGSGLADLPTVYSNDAKSLDSGSAVAGTAIAADALFSSAAPTVAGSVSVGAPILSDAVTGAVLGAPSLAPIAGGITDAAAVAAPAYTEAAAAAAAASTAATVATASTAASAGVATGVAAEAGAATLATDVGTTAVASSTFSSALSTANPYIIAAAAIYSLDAEFNDGQISRSLGDAGTDTYNFISGGIQDTENWLGKAGTNVYNEVSSWFDGW